MLIQQVDRFCLQLASLRASGDFEELKNLQQGCDDFLRRNLPVPVDSPDFGPELLRVMEQLLEQYRLAMEAVVSARQELEIQLQSAGRSRAQTNQYLTVASHPPR